MKPTFKYQPQTADTLIAKAVDALLDGDTIQATSLDSLLDEARDHRAEHRSGTIISRLDSENSDGDDEDMVIADYELEADAWRKNLNEDPVRLKDFATSKVSEAFHDSKLDLEFWEHQSQIAGYEEACEQANDEAKL
jgi:hypothetical protein